MKNFTLFSIFLMMQFFAFTQGTNSCNYILDFKEQSTFSAGCEFGTYSVNPNHWTVAEADCSLEANLKDWADCNTSNNTVNYVDELVPIDVIVNRAGNMVSGDFFQIQIMCTSTTSWETLLEVNHSEMNAEPSVHLYRAWFNPSYCTEEIRVRVRANSTMNNNHIQIKNGEFTLNSLLDPLPVELLGFDSRNENDKSINLFWSTATELNNSHFEIERSNDGRNFQSIGKVEGHGNSSEVKVYDFYDEKPMNGKNYYRLKQIDFDGTFEYSYVILEEVKRKETILELFPNPAIHTLVLQSPTKGDVIIYDALGKVISTFSKIDDTMTFDVSQLQPGLYKLLFQSSDKSEWIVQNICIVQ